MENTAMRRLREKIGGRTAAVPPDVESILDEGLVEADGCLFLAYFARRDHSPRSKSEDEIGFEAFINQFFIEAATVENAALLGLASLEMLVTVLQQHPLARPCTAILGVDVGKESGVPSASLRFHVRRDGAAWLSDDLDGYEEPVLAVEVDPIRT